MAQRFDLAGSDDDWPVARPTASAAAVAAVAMINAPDILILTNVVGGRSGRATKSGRFLSDLSRNDNVTISSTNFITRRSLRRFTLMHAGKVWSRQAGAIVASRGGPASTTTSAAI